MRCETTRQTAQCSRNFLAVAVWPYNSPFLDCRAIFTPVVALERTEGGQDGVDGFQPIRPFNVPDPALVDTGGGR